MSIVENNEIFLYCTPIIRTDLLYIYLNHYSKSVCMPNGIDTQIDRDQLIFILVYHLTDQG